MDRPINQIMNATALPKADFMLGWVDIHINQIRIKIQKYGVHRMPAMKEHILITLPHRVTADLVPNAAIVHKKILLVSLTPRIRGERNPAL